MKRKTLLLLPLLLLACKTNPITGRSQFLLVSKGQVEQLAVQSYQQTLQQARVATDPRLTQPLLQVGHAIAAAAEKLYPKPTQGFQWEFHVIDDDKTVNAWCMPGGKIAFYTGIYPIAKGEAGMAVIMGHEVMHAVLEHGRERVSDQLVQQLGLSVADLLTKQSQHHDVVMGALGVGSEVGILKPFSRTQESDADHYGLFLAAHAGYDPRVAIRVWSDMSKLGGEPPEILSDHPASAKRLENMKKWMPEAMKIYESVPHMPDRPLPGR